ncbi:2-octaprenyl-6-methoxyphenyl hydroxylase [Parahalioglobus pacificus]|nr:2-octaprenyl-6-methoxyphenyl hydroxylase [Halioglobus pacificus]
MGEQRNVVIAGGGMVGISLALVLANQLPDTTRITLVESVPLPSSGDKAPTYHPSFDARSTALSFSSRRIYEALGIWEGLAQWACPINTIHVSNRGRFGSTVLQASEYDWPALGYVVENAWLGRYLLHALQQQGRVELLSPASVTAAEADGKGMRLVLSHPELTELHTDLLVVADGAGSPLRESLGVIASEKPYGQHALVANIAFAQAHSGCAFERFTDQGPLALLPLLSAAGAEHRAGLVWTLPPARAKTLCEASDAEFLEALQERFGYRLGRLRQVGERHAYPLALLRAGEQVRQGVVIMGNAAHSLHPVAGQGFNLALRDIAALTETVAAALSAGKELGDLTALQRYESAQAQDQEQTIQFSDLVPQVFMNSDPLLGLTRDMALSGLDVLAPLKHQFVRHAAGIAAMGGSGG